MLDGLLDDILNSPISGEIRPDSPPIRPAESLDITDVSPDSPDSPAPNVTEPNGGLKPEDRAAIMRWLTFIGENSQPIINDVLGYCASNQDALAYYLKRAEELPLNDNRHHCRECRHINSRGYCTKQQFKPVDDIPRRCDDFAEKNRNSKTIQGSFNLLSGQI